MPGNKRKKNLIPQPEEPRRPGGRIPPAEGPKNRISFSFRYAQLKCEKFRISHKDANYFRKIIERLKNISGETPEILLKSLDRSRRCHRITWSDTSEKKGFAHLLPKDLKDTPPHQFAVSANEGGRVHGIFVGSLFYIVWFDPDHKLYPRN